MILGVGTDMIEIKRVKKACEKGAFLLRCFTEEERRQGGNNITFLAGNFAVKESVAKVFGTGFRHFMPIDIEVLRDELGKPYVRLYGGANKIYNDMGFTNLQVSISNTQELAIAFAVGEGDIL